MYQTMLPHQQNLGQFQMYGCQQSNAEHFVQPQLRPFQRVSPNIVSMGQPDGTHMAPLFLPESIHTRGIGSQYAGVRFVNSTASTDPYSCNFIEQLEGSYETESPDVKGVQVELVDGQRYANVRRYDERGEHVVTQLIYEDEKRFRLCSLEGFVLAIMMKGKDMRNSVTWYTNDGSKVVWDRTGDVTFKLVTMTPEQSRRNSLVSNFSGTSQMSYSQVDPSEVIPDVRMRIRPELRTQKEPSLEKEQTDREPRRLSSKQHTNVISSESPSSEDKSSSASDKTLTEDELFDQLKRYCVKFPSLLQEVIQWGITRTPNRRVGAKDISDYASGKIWVRAALMDPPRGCTESWQEVLNEFKGAYQEDEPGVFMQPPSQPNEPGKQHRIRRNNMGFWMIEEHDVNENAWYPCTQEVPYGHWVDLKDSRRRYNIQLMPMVSILNRMQDQCTDHDEMEKSMDFLFNSCNQKKLNTRLKARNLKHNISNLRLKLEKQYALSFAVRVAEIADAIALEEQVVSCIKTEA